MTEWTGLDDYDDENELEVPGKPQRIGKPRKKHAKHLIKSFDVKITYISLHAKERFLERYHQIAQPQDSRGKPKPYPQELLDRAERDLKSLLEECDVHIVEELENGAFRVRFNELYAIVDTRGHVISYSGDMRDFKGKGRRKRLRGIPKEGRKRKQ